jgi:hypothetical protein
MKTRTHGCSLNVSCQTKVVHKLIESMVHEHTTRSLQDIEYKKIFTTHSAYFRTGCCCPYIYFTTLSQEESLSVHCIHTLFTGRVRPSVPHCYLYNFSTIIPYPFIALSHSRLRALRDSTTPTSRTTSTTNKHALTQIEAHHLPIHSHPQSGNHGDDNAPPHQRRRSNLRPRRKHNLHQPGFPALANRPHANNARVLVETFANRTVLVTPPDDLYSSHVPSSSPQSTFRIERFSNNENAIRALGQIVHVSKTRELLFSVQVLAPHLNAGVLEKATEACLDKECGGKEGSCKWEWLNRGKGQFGYISGVRVYDTDKSHLQAVREKLEVLYKGHVALYRDVSGHRYEFSEIWHPSLATDVGRCWLWGLSERYGCLVRADDTMHCIRIYGKPETGYSISNIESTLGRGVMALNNNRKTKHRINLLPELITSGNPTDIGLLPAVPWSTRRSERQAPSGVSSRRTGYELHFPPRAKHQPHLLLTIPGIPLGMDAATPPRSKRMPPVFRTHNRHTPLLRPRILRHMFLPPNLPRHLRHHHLIALSAKMLGLGVRSPDPPCRPTDAPHSAPLHPSPNHPPKLANPPTSRQVPCMRPPRLSLHLSTKHRLPNNLLPLLLTILALLRATPAPLHFMRRIPPPPSPIPPLFWCNNNASARPHSGYPNKEVSEVSLLHAEGGGG